MTIATADVGSAWHRLFRYLAKMAAEKCTKGVHRSQAPRSSAYFHNPPMLSGQAWYCSFLAGCGRVPQIMEVDIPVHSNTSGEIFYFSIKGS